MIDLEKLRYNQVHPLKTIFDQYDRRQIANELNISSEFLGDILQGNKQPSPELEKIMQHLSYEILKAEAKER